MEWPVGGLIEGRYEVFDIKVQSLGIVYICYDHQTRDPVVIKTFPDVSLSLDQNRARFIANAQAWRELGAHPHIVQAIDVRDIEGKPHVFVEFVEPSEAGHTLRWRLHAGRVPLDEAVDILLAACRGLMHAAEVKPDLMHGDIRPENIMITRDGTVKVTDFGMMTSLIDPSAIQILKLVTEAPLEPGITLSEGGIPLCAPQYCAPERLLHAQPASVGSDMYAFGCVAYELLTHRWLFDATKTSEFLHMHISQDPVPIHDSGADVPEAICQAVMRCLAKDPGERFGSFAEAHDALESAWLSAAASIETPTPEPPGEEVELAGEPIAEDLPGEPEASDTDAADRALEVPEPEPAVVPYDDEIQEEAPDDMSMGESIEPEGVELTPEPEEAEEPEEQQPELEAPEPEPELEAGPEEQQAEQAGEPTVAPTVAELNGQAMQAARGGNIEDAIRLWQDVLREDWQMPSAHANLGAALAGRGDTKRAHTHLREAVRLAPKRPQAHFNIGRLHHDQGEFEKAVAAYESALALDPDYGVAYVALGATLEAQGNLTRAAEAYREAVARSENAQARARLVALGEADE